MWCWPDLFQFTHPCGCDSGNLVSGIWIPVSIHAPVWVRHLSLVDESQKLSVSIHAPVWVRLLLFGYKAVFDAVSIHAPVWVRPLIFRPEVPPVQFQFTHPCGCDCVHVSPNMDCVGFNSRTRVGATGTVGFSDWTAMFQFTHPCGCDLWALEAPFPVLCFNSRTRVGATTAEPLKASNINVSIHAPVWVRRPDEYGLSIKHATKVLRQPDARTGCGQA